MGSELDRYVHYYMKIVFRDLGPKKFSKIVEVTSIIGFLDIKEFMSVEIEPHMPDDGFFELVPTDGLPDLVANQYVVVHQDIGFVSRGMGIVMVYH